MIKRKLSLLILSKNKMKYDSVVYRPEWKCRRLDTPSVYLKTFSILVFGNIAYCIIVYCIILYT